MRKQIVGFTLIELLIVVAIISILAAIAIPNFLEAQVRAKVARVQSEYRNMKVALMIYQLDNDEWPDSEDGALGDHSTLYNLTELSTPIAYMSSVPYQDPFSKAGVTDVHGYPQSNNYQYWCWEYDGGGTRYLAPPDPLSQYGKQVPMLSWVLVNPGPSRDWPFGFMWGITYDATNGTISQGTLWCSEIGIYGD